MFDEDNDNFGNRTVSWILKVAVATLSLCTLLVVGVLLTAMLFQRVESESVFTIIGPAINTIIGAFVGLLGGLTISNFTATHPTVKPSEPAKQEAVVNEEDNNASK